MKFARDELRDVIWNDSEILKLVRDELVGTTRWSTVHDLIFEYSGKFYQTKYRRGATEHQDEQPFERDGDSEGMIECLEVEPYEKTIIEYRPIGAFQ